MPIKATITYLALLNRQQCGCLSTVYARCRWLYKSILIDGSDNCGVLHSAIYGHFLRATRPMINDHHCHLLEAGCTLRWMWKEVRISHVKLLFRVNYFLLLLVNVKYLKYIYSKQFYFVCCREFSFRMVQ